MRLAWSAIAVALAAVGLAACSTTKSKKQTTVATTSAGTAQGDALAENVCERSLELFTEHRFPYVGGEKSVPDRCRSVRVEKADGGLVATVYYHGDPVAWRFSVERGTGESKNEAYLPGLKKALQSPGKLKHQRASDSVIMLKSFVVDYYKSYGEGTFPTSIDNLTRLEEVSTIPKDPWGAPYLYTTTGNRFAVVSPGPDGRTNTSDDIDADSNCVGGSQPCLEVIHVY